MKKNNKKGFTIVELVIVIAVIAILAAVLIPTFSGVVSRANDSAALQEAKNAYSATLAEYLTDEDPANDAALDNIIVQSKDKLVKIDNGSAKIVTEGTATYKVENGKLVSLGTTTPDPVEL